MNCWEFNKCGNNIKRDDGKSLCPTFEKNAGDECWMILGTRCKGRIQQTGKEKKEVCRSCDYYAQYDRDHKSRVSYKYQLLKGDL